MDQPKCCSIRDHLDSPELDGGLPTHPPWPRGFATPTLEAALGMAGGKGERWKLHLPRSPGPQKQRWRQHAGKGVRHVACCFAPHFCATAPEKGSGASP